MSSAPHPKPQEPMCKCQAALCFALTLKGNPGDAGWLFQNQRTWGGLGWGLEADWFPSRGPSEQGLVEMGSEDFRLLHILAPQRTLRPFCSHCALSVSACGITWELVKNAGSHFLQDLTC